MNNLISKLFKIAKQNPQGFTVNIETWDFIRFGYVVSYKETQSSFGKHQIENVIKHSLEHEKIIGGWFYEDKYYYDSCKVFYSLDKAKKFAKENKQIAIFDLTNLKEIIIK